MLAVLKAGGAFSMLPPSLPGGRRESMISAIEPAVVVTSMQYAHYFPNVKTILPQEYKAAGEDDSKLLNFPRRAMPDSRAAVLFTSGTTGNPKGIMLDHRCLATTAQYMAKNFDVGTHTRVFQYASYSFDVSIHETLMVLMAGGCLCIPSEDDRHNDLAGSVMRLQANWASLSPSVARAITPESVSTLATLVFAGEALNERDVLSWVDKLTIFNWYGPAEYSLSASSPVQLPGWTSGNLGFGSASTCWVVRPENRDALSPFGAIGELVVEGPALMMGYLHDEDKTVAMIMTNPSWLSRGAHQFPGRHGRVYQTGDLVSYNADGSLTYIGRKDAQVKIRGQRVELQEVEHHLVQQLHRMGAVASQAIAEVITPVGNASPKLAAFIKGGGSQFQLNELENKLAGVLPSYMIPSLYINVSDIPITANGKTDRKKLRAMGSSLTREQTASLRHTPGKQERILPRTIVEKKLQELWTFILGLDTSISIEDHFFEVGGDSIAAMRLVSAARQNGLSFTVADIFSRPLLGDLAAIAQPVITKPNNTTIQPFALLDGNARAFVRAQLTHMISFSDGFPVTHWQSTCVELALESPPRLLDHFFVDLPRDMSLEEVTRGCGDLWQNMDILRTIFIPWENQYLQIVPEQLDSPVQYYSTKEENIEDLTARICKEDSQQPLALVAPFTRFHVLSGNAGAIRLMIRLSHAQYDGTGLIHLLQCLRASFNREPLPKRVHFPAFIQHARNNQDASVKYWRTLLSGSSLTRIAADRINSNSSGPLDPIVLERRVELLPSNDRFTPATTFTAACAHFLFQITKSSDVIFGRLVSGRAMLPVQLRNTVGPCVNIIPVRVHGTQSLEQTRQSVHEQLIDSLPFDTIGTKEVIEKCTDWPQDARPFGLITSYQDLGDAEEEIRGVPCRLHCYEDTRAGSKMMEDDAVMVFAKPMGDYLQIVVNADGRLYTEQTVRRWCDMLADNIQSFRQLEQSD